MDLVAAELVRHMPSTFVPSFIQPRLKQRITKFKSPGVQASSIHILDRLWNRQWDYPRFAKRELNGRFDAYHVVDHSYAALVHSLPHARTGVYCHDLDAFRCLLDPKSEPRPFWFRAMTRRILAGMQKASIVFHNSVQTGEALRRWNLVPAAHLVHAPLGTALEFSADPSAHSSEAVLSMIERVKDCPVLLHVGSNIARKRIDLLLRYFQAILQRFPETLLIKVGEDWTKEQQSVIEDLRLAGSILCVGKLDRANLAACYRRADSVLISSDAEGFGLPVIEAMACGTQVIASDIPVLRETGGEAALYASIGDIDMWVSQVARVISKDVSVPSKEMRLAWAAKFSWVEHARIIAEAYQKLL